MSSNLFRDITLTGMPEGHGFKAYKSGVMSATNNAYTTVLLDATSINDNLWFDIVNSRFQPTEPGRYFIYGAVRMNLNNGNQIACSLNKSGSGFGSSDQFAGNGFGPTTASTSGLVALNGSTDYVDMSVFHNIGSASDVWAGATLTYMTGFMVEQL